MKRDVSVPALACAVLLLVAAIAKATTPLAREEAAWIRFAAIGAEVLIAASLLLPRWRATAALTAFSMFAGTAVGKAAAHISGAAMSACKCLGTLGRASWVDAGFQAAIIVCAVMTVREHVPRVLAPRLDGGGSPSGGRPPRPGGPRGS